MIYRKKKKVNNDPAQIHAPVESKRKPNYQYLRHRNKNNIADGYLRPMENPNRYTDIMSQNHDLGYSPLAAADPKRKQPQENHQDKAHRDRNNINIVDRYFRPTGNPNRYHENMRQNHLLGLRPLPAADQKRKQIQENPRRGNHQDDAHRNRNNKKIVDGYVKPTGNLNRYSEYIRPNNDFGFRPLAAAGQKRNQPQGIHQGEARRPYINVKSPAQHAAHAHIPTSRRAMHNNARVQPKLQEEQEINIDFGIEFDI